MDQCISRGSYHAYCDHHLWLFYIYFQQNILIMLTGCPKSLKQSIINRLQHKQVENSNQRMATQSCIDVDQQIRQFGLMKLIQIHQDWDHKGYFNYQGWMIINKQIWGERIMLVAQELWKIVRIVNQGHVLIPTGVTFQLINTLIVSPSQHQIRNILESFLVKNKIKVKLNSIKQLKNYQSLQKIVDVYAGKEEVREEKKSKVTVKAKKSNQMLYKRLSQSDKNKQNKLRLLKYKSISQEMQQCSFQPSISKYNPQPLQDSNKIESQQTFLEKQSSTFQKFKATLPDASIFEGSVMSIPGAKQHINRQELCQFQRKRVQRFLRCPIGTLK